MECHQVKSIRYSSVAACAKIHEISMQNAMFAVFIGAMALLAVIAVIAPLFV
jgi:hypothetical protein